MTQGEFDALSVGDRIVVARTEGRLTPQSVGAVFMLHRNLQFSIDVTIPSRGCCLWPEFRDAETVYNIRSSSVLLCCEVVKKRGVPDDAKRT